MLFNSYVFILFFLPVCFILVWFSRRMFGNGAAEIALICASVAFYSWGGLSSLTLLVTLVVANYFIGLSLIRGFDGPAKNLILASGIALNVGVLGYFKYRGFVLENLHLAAAGTARNVVIPLAISFFTFQKIAFLVECWRGHIRAVTFRRFLIFVSFFPQLIAGPIVRFDEVGAQFDNITPPGETNRNLAVGSTLFILGLFKKLTIADGLGGDVDQLFAGLANGSTTGVGLAWWAALLYTLQLYFDFSGYSDMAIGLARLFGIVLPLNFFSPYRATSIIIFWRRWHITLSRFLRDFLYVPLGGSHKGQVRRYANLLATMLIGGLWHGAGWNFILWGGLHGFYLCVNHLFRSLPKQHLRPIPRACARFAGWAITMVAVMVGWVIFRAPDIASGYTIVYQMLFGPLVNNGFEFKTTTMALCSLALIVVLVMPNAYEWLRNYHPALGCDDPPGKPWPFVLFLTWQPALIPLLAVLVMGCWAIFNLDQNREFIYFRF
jgi:D-alanyl-lipoteichoic acid acyltransferase DltB (MBOAT superfamily)